MEIQKFIETEVYELYHKPIIPKHLYKIMLLWKRYFKHILALNKKKNPTEQLPNQQTTFTHKNNCIALNMSDEEIAEVLRKILASYRKSQVSKINTHVKNSLFEQIYTYLKEEERMCPKEIERNKSNILVEVENVIGYKILTTSYYVHLDSFTYREMQYITNRLITIHNMKYSKERVEEILYKELKYSQHLFKYRVNEDVLKKYQFSFNVQSSEVKELIEEYAKLLTKTYYDAYYTTTSMSLSKMVEVGLGDMLTVYVTQRYQYIESKIVHYLNKLSVEVIAKEGLNIPYLRQLDITPEEFLKRIGNHFSRYYLVEIMKQKPTRQNYISVIEAIYNEIKENQLVRYIENYANIKRNFITMQTTNLFSNWYRVVDSLATYPTTHPQIQYDVTDTYIPNGYRVISIRYKKHHVIITPYGIYSVDARGCMEFVLAEYITGKAEYTEVEERVNNPKYIPKTLRKEIQQFVRLKLKLLFEGAYIYESNTVD